MQDKLTVFFNRFEQSIITEFCDGIRRIDR